MSPTTSTHLHDAREEDVVLEGVGQAPGVLVEQLQQVDVRAAHALPLLNRLLDELLTRSSNILNTVVVSCASCAAVPVTL